MTVYLDTSAIIALFSPDDRLHGIAEAHAQRLAQDDEHIITGWHSIIEYIDGLAKRQGQREAIRVLGDLRRARKLHIVGSETHLAEALAVFDNVKDRDVDLSDCLSFALMDAYGCDRAFTFDGDFAKAGFQCEPTSTEPSGKRRARPTK